MENKTAMTAQELRIGNWVTANMVKSKVIDVMCDCINTANFEGLPYDLIEPIELTPEILEKAGFVKGIELQDFNGRYWYYQYGKVQGNFYPTTHEFKPEWGKFKTITSLHQLQNLTHALTGEELTISLT